MKEHYTKQPTSITDQINLLEAKGMEISNREDAIRKIAVIGYYRFSGFAYSFRNKLDNSSFIEDTTFDKVISVYEFDRKLKSILFDCIERIEIAFRAQIIDRISLITGTPFWFCDKQYFLNIAEYNSFLKKLDNEINDSQEDFINHFYNNYDDNYPPAWVTLQLLSFGGLINLFRNINLDESQAQIALFFGCESVSRFISWINTLVYIRNICGHHARLWNISIKKKPQAYHFGDKSKRRDNTTLYYTVCVIKYLLDKIQPDNDLKEKLEALFHENPYPNSVKLTYIGFSKDWENDSLW